MLFDTRWARWKLCPSACLTCILVFTGVLPTTAFTARYVLLCLAVSCAFSIAGPQLSWLTGNLRNTGEMTLIVPLNGSISTFGQIIGMSHSYYAVLDVFGGDSVHSFMRVGLFIFKDSESPGFPTGHSTIAGFMFLGAALGVVLRRVYTSRNRKVSPGEQRWRL